MRGFRLLFCQLQTTSRKRHSIIIAGMTERLSLYLFMMALLRFAFVESFAAVSMALKAPASCPPCVICPGFGNDARDCENPHPIACQSNHISCKLHEQCTQLYVFLAIPCSRNVSRSFPTNHVSQLLYKSRLAASLQITDRRYTSSLTSFILVPIVCTCTLFVFSF